jgi:succinate--hydroxymethylglutarate CoA-transferase
MGILLLVLAALYAREKTGLGQKLDVSLLGCQVASLANIGSNFLIDGLEAKRMGTAHGAIVPYQSFPTKDGHIVIGSGNDSQFLKFLKALDRSDLNVEEYSTNLLRVQNRKDLIKELTKTMKGKTTDTWLQILDGVGIPYGPVNNISKTFSHPQVIHQKMIHELDHPTAGKIKVVAPPVKYSLSKPSIRLPPPTLGQHTDEVLSELGYTKDDIFKLKQSKAI